MGLGDKNAKSFLNKNSGKELTLDQFKRVMPIRLKNSLTEEILDNVNGLMNDPFLRDNYRDNLLSYTSVLKEGKFKLESYLDAVRYISFKLLGSSNIEAYTRTFPDRYQRFLDTNVCDKDIASYVSAFNKNKLVNLIYEQTLIPSHILNADMYQKALNAQSDLMMNAKSEKVRSDAANSILTHLKRPETTKIELDIGIKEDSAIRELKATTLELVAQQREMIKAGANSVEEIAHSKLKVIEGEVID